MRYPRDWNRFADPDKPFLRHEHLAAHKRHVGLRDQLGWLPPHFEHPSTAKALAAAHCFLQLGPLGKVVFGFPQASAYRRAGRNDYPEPVIVSLCTPPPICTSFAASHTDMPLRRLSSHNLLARYSIGLTCRLCIGCSPGKRRGYGSNTSR